MPTRKETPDVLGAVLGESAADSNTQPESSSPSVTTKPAQERANRKRSNVRKQKSTQKLRKWEYQTVTFHEYGAWKPRLIDQIEIEGWKNMPDMPDYLAHLGDEGWELAGVSKIGRNQILAYFKRSKS
ncbi:MAG: hypothetical protein GY762_23695 [Proteobacteria bacterium]|nr:hypothetical protein [Pseudomonadota bacterium]